MIAYATIGTYDPAKGAEVYDALLVEMDGQCALDVPRVVL